MTTGISPDGAGTGLELDDRLPCGVAWRALRRRRSRHSRGIEQLPPDRCVRATGTRSACRCRRRPPREMRASTRTTSSRASRPSLLATSTLLAAVAIAGRHLHHLGADRHGLHRRSSGAARPWTPWAPSRARARPGVDHLRLARGKRPRCERPHRPGSRPLQRRRPMPLRRARTGSDRWCGRSRWSHRLITRMPTPRSRP